VEDYSRPNPQTVLMVIPSIVKGCDQVVGLDNAKGNMLRRTHVESSADERCKGPAACRGAGAFDQRPAGVSASNQ
jgi:hypothetical protein